MIGVKLLGEMNIKYSSDKNEQDLERVLGDKYE